MTRRARLVLGPVLVLAVAVMLLSLAPPPASAFPITSVYNKNLPAPGAGPIAVGDLDGDGLTDIVAVDEVTGSWNVFLQTPTGLPTNPTFAIPGVAARKLLMVDMDGNGAKDLVALGTNSTWIYYQDNATFGRTSDLKRTQGVDINVADMNGDGKLDIAILTQQEIQLWFQNDTGSWPLWPSVNLTNTTRGYQDIALADLSDDGFADVVIAKPHELRVFAQDVGMLDIAGRQRYVLDTSDNGTMTLEIADLNGDRRLDAVLTDVDPAAATEWLSVYMQESGSFNLTAKIGGPVTGPVAIGDLNDDGVPDVAAAMHEPMTGADTVGVYVQRFTGGFDTSASFQVSLEGLGNPTAIAIARLSGRPFNDLVARTPGSLLLYEQDDLPPALIQAVPSDFFFNQESSGNGLVNLRNYFADDHGILRFRVEFEELPSVLHATLSPDGNRLDFTARANWYGQARFQVAASDGSPGHPWVVSNTFTVMVNALPRFTSAAPGQARAGEKFIYQLTISDPFPADDSHVFSLLESPAGMTIDAMTGLVEWTPREFDAGSHIVRAKVVDAYGAIAELSFDLQVVVAPTPLPTTAVVAATTLGALVALGVGAVASENVKYSLLMIFIPLYSKIKREQVLDHFVRGQIYGYVLANPGEHYNAIKLALNLTNGSLAHHLKTLERERFIKSKRFGLYRRFYPMNMKIPEDGFFTPNEIQKTIVELIRATPAITQKEIAEALGLTPPTVNYHIGILSQHGAIRVERAGRKTHCFVIEPGTSTETSTGTSTPSGGPATPGPSAPRPPP